MAHMNRHLTFWSWATVLTACAAATGCMSPLLRPTPAPTTETTTETKGPEVQLVGSVAHPYGMTYMKVENVALVTGLPGTGEDPPPSTQRAAMLAELNRREVANPNAILASPNTALVVVRGFLRPGIRAGEKFDVEVRTPSRSDTTSLRGGWLLETSLTETAVLGQQIRKGRVMAVAQGPILVDPSATADDNPALVTQGRILGGGVASKDRGLGLILDHEHQSVRLSQLIGKAINVRFHTYIDGSKQGVATPKTDEFIDIVMHPRYRDNVSRYMRVLRSIPVRESASQRQTRQQLLRDQLLDPVTSSTAALRLEALGDAEAVATLKEGIASADAEVRFYAAEALAYLDDTAAVAPLAEAAESQPAFRINALAALAAMDDGMAYDALVKMLSVKSAETRYGAFRALWTMDAQDLLVRGENMADKFQYHALNVPGEPMIHVTSSHHPEIVLFGKNHPLRLPLVLDAGQRILVNGLTGDEITVSFFAPGSPPQQRVAPANVDALIRAVVDLGGDYPDVVQMLQQANHAGVLSSRFRVNALPETGRALDATSGEAEEADPTAAEAADAADAPSPEPAA